MEVDPESLTIRQNNVFHYLWTSYAFSSRRWFSGTVGSWGKKVGDKCSPGESVAEIETDKASMAYEAQDEFYIAKLLIDAGVEVPVGSPMMVTVEVSHS